VRHIKEIFPRLERGKTKLQLYHTYKNRDFCRGIDGNKDNSGKSQDNQDRLFSDILAFHAGKGIGK